MSQISGASASSAAPAGGLAAMHPASFGMVMATGIVSIASHLVGATEQATGVAGATLRGVALALFFANIAFYVLLWGLSIARVLRYREHVIADLMHHGRCVGFFTTVAATCVLGSQVWIVGGALLPGASETPWLVAFGLWLFGLVLWAVITYTVFTILTVKSAKPTLAEGINGGWLLAVVASQSVAALGAQLALGLSPQSQAPLIMLCLAMWLGGGMLYVWIISLIFYRYTFFTLSPSDLAPPYWINMGAVAISTLAGTMLIANAPHSPLLQELLPFIKGVTIAFWATATWWIPMLVILGVWRHGAQRFPFRYDPLYWGAVFPLGMYAASTFRLSQALDSPHLEPIARGFIWLAICGWALTFAGLLRRIMGKINSRHSPGGASIDAAGSG